MKNEVLTLKHVTLFEKGKRQLDDISLRICSGDIIGLVNIGYQGLSALLDLILYNRRLDVGSVFFMGKEVSSIDFCQRKPNKITLVESLSHLIFSMNICDNFFFIKEHSPFFVQKKKQLSQLDEIFKEYGLTFTGTEYPSELLTVERCKLELVKACMSGSKLIIVKNPGAFLTPPEVKEIHALMKKITQQKKTAFLYLSNYFSDISEICNSVAVMRKGSILLKKEMKFITPQLLKNIQENIVRSFESLILNENADKKNAALTALLSYRDILQLPIHKGECTEISFCLRQPINALDS